MRYIILGVNRVTKDFLYVFEEINPIFVVDDEYPNLLFENIQVEKSNALITRRDEYDQIIVCGIDKEKYISILNRIGYEYGNEYVHERDLFVQLDENPLNGKKKKVCVWGTGRYAERFTEWNDVYDIEFYIDSKKKLPEYNGKKVVSPEIVDDFKNYFVIVAISNDDSVVLYLEKLGLREYDDYINIVKLMNQPSIMLEQTIFGESHYVDVHCNTMLNHAELMEDGKIYDCCSTFMYSPIGKIGDNSFKDVWNSMAHKIKCLSLQNKTYTFCKKNMCPLFIKKEATNECQAVLQQPYKKMKEAPTTVLLAYDSTCNLKCESCREEIKVARGIELEKALKMSQIAKDEMLADAEFLIMAGSGEVFFSKAYEVVYRSEEAGKIPYIRLLSNGMLFNEKNWKQFYEGKTGKIMLTVSVDAATKETYETLRRNGNFDVLKRNMEFAAGLRKEGKLSYFRLNFVVQQKNYTEMPAFVEWGMHLGVDEVFFTKIMNWGTYSPEEYAEISMMEADGVTPKDEFVEVLNHPLMKERIVDMGTIRYGHEEVQETVIDNYYRWELERKVADLFMNPAL